MEQPLFNSDQPNESEQDREIRKLMLNNADGFDNEPVWNGEFYSVPFSGTFNICGFVMKLEPGDIVKIDSETGVPYLETSDK